MKLNDWKEMLVDVKSKFPGFWETVMLNARKNEDGGLSIASFFVTAVDLINHRTGFYSEEGEAVPKEDAVTAFVVKQISREKCLRCGKDANYNAENLFYLCLPCSKSLRDSLPE